MGTTADGNEVRVLESKHGSVQFEVWEYCAGGQVSVLGKVSVLALGDRAVYKGTCCVHRQCFCVTNGLEAEGILQWLRLAKDSSACKHAELSPEVRRSLGMRVRRSRAEDV